MSMEKIKIADTPEWKQVRDYIQTQLLLVRDINFPASLDESLLKTIEISKDPLRAGQMFAYKILSNILAGILAKETNESRDRSKDGYT